MFNYAIDCTFNRAAWLSEQFGQDYRAWMDNNCCIIIGDEPAYAKIDGAWKIEKPYAVLHRMAFSSRDRGGGLSHNAFQLIKDFCRLSR